MKSRIALLAIPSLVLAACGSRGGNGPGAIPAPQQIDPAIETEAVSSTARTAPVQILFSWNVTDRDARFTGEGVARVAPPDRARVDLFGPRGEGYLSAVVEGDELRLPSGAANVPLPPPELFWNVLGSFRPPDGAELVGAARDNTTTRLEYANGDDRWKFTLEDGTLRRAEWTGDGQGRRTVELTGRDSLGLPIGATYRDWPAFLELRLTTKEVRNVNGFPSEIWTLRR